MDEVVSHCVHGTFQSVIFWGFLAVCLPDQDSSPRGAALAHHVLQGPRADTEQDFQEDLMSGDRYLLARLQPTQAAGASL